MSLNGVSDSEKRPVDFSVFAVLYSVDRAASRYKFFEITNLTLFFMYLFIYLFLLSTCFERHSAHHQGIELYRLIIPDDVLIQFDLLMMSTVMLETCREMKWINKYKKKCVKLVISKNLCLLCRHMFLFQPSFYKNPFIFWGKVGQYSRTTGGGGWPALVAWCPTISAGDMAIYTVVCLKTVPCPFQSQFSTDCDLSASSFNFQYPLFP